MQAGKVRFELLAGAMVPITALLFITGIRFGLWDGLTTTALFLASLLAHEMAHAIVATMTGTRCSALGFCLRGAYIRRERAQGITELAISAAGPTVNFLLTLLLWNARGVWGWLAQMNAVLTVVNLLPWSGSDGGRMLTELRVIVGSRLSPVAESVVSGDSQLSRGDQMAFSAASGVPSRDAIDEGFR